MTAADFQRIALSLKGAEEGAHMGATDFRVGGRIFATLAAQREGYGNLMFDSETQAAFLQEWREFFLPIKGGWGRMGMMHVRLEPVSEDVLRIALTAAWKLRVAKNVKGSKKRVGARQVV